MLLLGDEASTEAASFPLRSPSMVLSSPCQSQPPTSFPQPSSPSTHLQPSAAQPPRTTFAPPLPSKTETASKEEKADAEERDQRGTTVVRSVSEYRRDQESVSEMRHKLLSKSNTTSKTAVDTCTISHTSPTFSSRNRRGVSPRRTRACSQVCRGERQFERVLRVLRSRSTRPAGRDLQRRKLGLDRLFPWQRMRGTTLSILSIIIAQM